jgi:phage shock protein C
MTSNQSPFQPQPTRQLRRSQTDRKLSGVCGGVAEYLNIDSTVVRIGVVVGTILSGGWLALAYVVAIVVMPDGKQPPVWNYPGQPTGPAPTQAAPTYPGQAAPNTGTEPPAPSTGAEPPAPTA